MFKLIIAPLTISGKPFVNLINFIDTLPYVEIQNEVEYSLYRKSLFLISAGFVCWVHHSKEIRSKLLTSGLLYSQIGAIEILNKNLQHKVNYTCTKLFIVTV